jgi:murein DD-endopeptidase MepM/ murein hydrolase activator NlpD
VVGRLKKSCTKLFVGPAIFALLAMSLEACFSQRPAPAPLNSSTAAVRPLSHAVQPGETVYHVAHIYGVSPARLMAANGLSDPRQLAAGQILIIPLNDRTPATASFSTTWPVARADRQFGWPVTAGLVSSPFGIRNGVMHDGVDIVAAAGTAVRAADDGTVIFVGHLRGYGNAVILRHSGGYVTVYGHNQRNIVRYGAEVVRGQAIAELGSTGRATGPNLHFEVRFQGQPQNPLAYLPAPPPTGISFARNGGS